jgi:hypothetical protein
MTLAEAYARIRSGVSPEPAFLEFLDAFDRASSMEELVHVLAAAPPRTGNKRLDAFAAAPAGCLYG